VIGFLGGGSPDTAAPGLTAFRLGLSEAGYVVGQNVAIEYRGAEGRFDRMPALIADLVGRKVDVIAITAGFLTVQLAKDATSTIPIVFFSGDPVEAGLVASLARPGGNLTGVSDMNVELLPKRFELLSELAPQARVMGLLVYSNSPSAERIISEVQAAARAKGVEILILKVSSESPARHLRRKNPQGREAGRSAGPAADDIRAGGQSEDRQGTWPHRPAIDPRPRRRGHRVSQRMAALGRTFPFSGKAGGSGLGSSRQLASAPLPDPPIKLADLPVQR